jgi:hypothetical protein
VERLRREARVAAQLSHSGIVAVHAMGEREDQIFIAMEYVEGQDLSNWVKERGRCRRRRDQLIYDFLNIPICVNPYEPLVPARRSCAPPPLGDGDSERYAGFLQRWRAVRVF